MTKRKSNSKLPVANAVAAEIAAKTLGADRAIVQRPGGKIGEAEYQAALERLAAGDTLKNVTHDLGLSRSALQVRANENRDFADQFYTALAMGTWSRLENAEDAILCGEHSTGSIERDKAYMDYAKWMAARLNRHVFGEKIQIDQRQVIINIPSSLTDI